MKSNKGISRRDFLKHAAAVGGAVLAGGIGYRQIHHHIGRDSQPERAETYLARITTSHDQGSPPNIVIILVDDLGDGDLESPALDTPNLDRMTAEGAQLTSFYACAPVCSPSRAGLLTGRYPVRTLITNPLFDTRDPMNMVMDVLGRYSYNVRGIPQDEVLLPEILKRRGYRTGLVGKWHLGSTSGHLPNERGIDSFYGAYWSNDDQPYAIYRNEQVAVPAPADQTNLTHNLTREAQAFIRSSQDQPFFLLLAHVMPHIPLHASAAFQGTSKAGLYGDAVQELDWSVGQVLETLEHLDLAENTLVVFTSDNGPWWQGNPGYARGRKLGYFEGGFRVPFIAHWPGTIPPGIQSPQMCMNFDLFSTCLGLAGIPLPDDRVIDGIDLLPILKGEDLTPHETLFFYDIRSLVAVRHHKYKYYRRYVTENAAYWPLRHGPFLFDLELDPNESYSLIENEPERAAELAGMLEDFETEIEENLRGWL